MVPPKTWDNMQSQRDFMLFLAKKLNIQKMEDWYDITQKKIRQKGGGGLLYRYNNAVSRMITSIFPEHQWNTINFRRTPNNTWDDLQVQKNFMINLAKKLNINTMEDWYRVTYKQIHFGGGGTLLYKYQHSPSKLIASVFHEHLWDVSKFTHFTRK
eukprot:TRINITY_DN3913_c0_g1_i1.p1 TRINITY_DN3913_c0_g1~~TRINITY_DN3913_c0_g1_i1.p1  ORF type:complete len:156 (-),score=14.67 TRINITY_DN3913_c0_g1_i1:15-482(-)